MMPNQVPSTSDPSSGARAVDSSTSMPLARVELTADARCGLARVVVRQHFRNESPVPLAVSYAFPLPADAAVSAYSFTVGERRIVGEIERREEARERFERAILDGKSAGLVEQDRSSLFTQELGNIPAGAEVVAELVLDQPLRWLDEGCWEWRFPLAAAPRYLGEPGRVTDAERVTLDVAQDGSFTRAVLGLTVRDEVATGRLESPSHALKVVAGSAGQTVAFEERGVPLDRDVVVRWQVATSGVMLSVDSGRPVFGPSANAAYGLLTVVPPLSASRGGIPRDVIVLLDTSGSMAGEPLDQARRVVSALVDTLTARDRLEMIEFSNQARRWKAAGLRLFGSGGPFHATEVHKRDALAWLAALRGSGGTEMRQAICEALAPLSAGSLRQVVLVTDGHIGFEREVVETIAERLPRGSRLHTVGVGSSVNRSLTRWAARVGRGVEVVVGLGEDAERAARRIVARTAAPIVVDIAIGGSALLRHAPDRLPDLYAGAPLLAAVKVRPAGGEIVVRGRGENGPVALSVQVGQIEPGAGNAAAAALFARETVEDLETRLAAVRKSASIEGAIEQTGLDFGIATRFTTWVAVSEEATVDPRDPSRRIRIPQMLPYGMSAEGVGLRTRSVGAPSFMRAMPPEAMAPTPAPPDGFRSMGAPHKPERKDLSSSDPWRAELPTARYPMAPPPDVKEKRFMPERRIPGRIVILRGDVVIELFVKGAPLRWYPQVPIILRFADSASVAALLVEEQTTRPGKIPRGSLVRLVLRLESPAPTARATCVSFVSGSERILVDL